MDKITSPSYCVDILERRRLLTREVEVGNIAIGGNQPVRVQSMTTTDTMNTSASVDQSVKMIDAGCELVRLTAPSKKEAENLAEIKASLVSAGYETPLVADIHFTPNAAEIAAKHVAKVRVNPGNYADKKRFEEISYTDESYQNELNRIEEKFSPLVLLCKKEGTAMRIGTNHGSLSDRILSRYGDTPEGMVESAMEFIRICIKHDFHRLVLSMKASNTLIMVQAYRLLVATMCSEGINYPLHLGVTEAGDGEDGRIKSAVGIGALLEDGLGDTIRVSLTEDPEAEIPVAKKLLSKFKFYDAPKKLSETTVELPYDPYHHTTRHSTKLSKIGGDQVPAVIGDLSSIVNIKPSNLFGLGYQYSVPLDKWTITDHAVDVLYLGKQQIDFETPGTLLILRDLQPWLKQKTKLKAHIPLVKKAELQHLPENQFAFIEHPAGSEDVEYLKSYPSSIVILSGSVHFIRMIRLNFAKYGINNPVILKCGYTDLDHESYQLWVSSNTGIHFIDGFGNGIYLTGDYPLQLKNTTSFGILQATRTRISKTEYISCPSCGRTLFDLQETTAKIRSRTSHLKGLKIGIMGCIVNGPGEMADADYGYVGTRPGKIHLYKEQEVVKKNVDEKEAVDELINLIKEHGDWIDPKH